MIMYVLWYNMLNFDVNSSHSNFFINHIQNTCTLQNLLMHIVYKAFVGLMIEDYMEDGGKRV